MERNFPEGALGERDRTPGGGCYQVTSLVYDDCIVYQESIPPPKGPKKILCFAYEHVDVERLGPLESANPSRAILRLAD